MTWRPMPLPSREERVAARAARLGALLVPGRAASMTRGVAGIPAAKPVRRSERSAEAYAHKAKLAGMGCMACRRIHGPHAPGHVELHHLRTGGWGKGDWTTLIPLCIEHHRGKTGVHGLGTKGFTAHHGFSQADLLADVQALIATTEKDE